MWRFQPSRALLERLKNANLDVTWRAGNLDRYLVFPFGQSRVEPCESFGGNRDQLLTVNRQPNGRRLVDHSSGMLSRQLTRCETRFGELIIGTDCHANVGDGDGRLIEDSDTVRAELRRGAGVSAPDCSETDQQNRCESR